MAPRGHPVDDGRLPSRPRLGAYSVMHLKWALARGARRAVVASIALPGAFILLAPTAHAQDSPTFDVQPRTVEAGSSVNVSGRCPPGSGDPHVFGSLVWDPSLPPLESFTGSMKPAVASDGSFSTTFPLPPETPGGMWRFALSCSSSDSDVVTPGPEIDVEVVAGSVERMSITAEPSPAVAGQSLEVSGAGCRAQGRPIDRLVVTLHRTTGDPRFPTPHVVSLTTAPDATGAWRVTLDVPADFPEGDAAVGVQCDDTMGQQPSWGRYHQAPLAVVAGSARPNSTPPTLPLTGMESDSRLLAESLLVAGVCTFLLATALLRRAAAIN